MSLSESLVVERSMTRESLSLLRTRVRLRRLVLIRDGPIIFNGDHDDDLDVGILNIKRIGASVTSSRIKIL